MRLAYGSGFIIAVLLSLVLYLLGITNPLQTVSAFLLISGLWTIIYGAAFAEDKLYYIGWGAGIAVLASFIVLPLNYTIALVLIVIIALIVFTALRPHGKSKVLAPSPPK